MPKFGKNKAGKGFVAAKKPVSFVPVKKPFLKQTHFVTNVAKKFQVAKTGQGKGHDDAFRQKLAQIDSSRLVWIGGLRDDVDWKTLQSHLVNAGAKPKITQIMGNGTACVSFLSAGDAVIARKKANGTKVKGQVMQVDAWTQKDKTLNRQPKAKAKANVGLTAQVNLVNRQPKAKAKANVGLTAQVNLAKANLAKAKAELMKAELAQKKATGKGNLEPQKKVVKTNLKQKANVKQVSVTDSAAMKEKLSTIDNKLKIWVGGLPGDLDWQRLRDVFASVAKPWIVHITKPGTACVAMKEIGHVLKSIAALNGAKISGKTIQVDSWTKK